VSTKNRDDVIVELVKALLLCAQNPEERTDNVLKAFLWDHSDDVIWLQELWDKHPEIKNDYMSDVKFRAMTTTLDTPMGLIVQVADREARIGGHTFFEQDFIIEFDTNYEPIERPTERITNKCRTHYQRALLELDGWPSIKLPDEILNQRGADREHPLYKKLRLTIPPKINKESIEKRVIITCVELNMSESFLLRLKELLNEPPQHFVNKTWQVWSRQDFESRLDRAETEAEALDLLLDQEEHFESHLVWQCVNWLRSMDK